MPQFYQTPVLSTEFLNELRKFRAIKVWENHHVLALTQCILIEAIRDTTFDYTFNYHATGNKMCPFNGIIDILLYQKYADEGLGVPFIPILFPVEVQQDFLEEGTDEVFSHP